MGNAKGRPTMTLEAIGELRKIVAAATPAPWSPEIAQAGDGRCDLETRDPGVVVADYMRWPDGVFAATMRAVMPRMLDEATVLIAEHAEARAENERLTKTLDAIRSSVGELVAAWAADDIGQIDGEFIERLAKVAGVNTGNEGRSK